MEGWVDLGVSYTPRWFTCPQTVTLQITTWLYRQLNPQLPGRKSNVLTVTLPNHIHQENKSVRQKRNRESSVQFYSVTSLCTRLNSNIAQFRAPPHRWSFMTGSNHCVKLHSRLCSRLIICPCKENSQHITCIVRTCYKYTLFQKRSRQTFGNNFLNS